MKSTVKLPKTCRAPHGARGLKFAAVLGLGISVESRPAWGAWIEMILTICTSAIIGGRAPHGARGLKSALLKAHKDDISRAPHGARGLK